MATPKHLFRCSSDQANGTNTPTLFAPASLSAHDISTSTITPIADHNADFLSLDSTNPSTTTTAGFGEQLRQALLWKKDQPKCPFLFFTTSPLFAVQLAAWRSTRKQFKDGTIVEPDTGVSITIIDTETARTSDGLPVQFQSVSELLITHSIELRNRSDNSLRTYADHWVVTSNVVPGEGSYHASLEDMVNNGFYELYPQIEAANDRRDPRPSLTTDDLRKFYFSSGGAGSLLMRESLDTAARVVMCFAPNVGGDDAGKTNRMSVCMAFVLSPRKRNLEDLAFRFWLQDHASENAGLVVTTTTTTDTTAGGAVHGVPDADEFVLLRRHFAGLNFLMEGLYFGLSIDSASIEKEKAEWARWWKANREEYRASHPRDQRQGQRQGWQDRRANRPRELLERRARRDSVIEAPIIDRHQLQEPRELFPGWQQRAPQGMHYVRHGHAHGYGVHRGSYGRQQQGGYQVLSSRPGDARTTRQQNRHARVVERRDQDGVYARRGYSNFGGSGY